MVSHSIHWNMQTMWNETKEKKKQKRMIKSKKKHYIDCKHYSFRQSLSLLSHPISNMVKNAFQLSNCYSLLFKSIRFSTRFEWLCDMLKCTHTKKFTPSRPFSNVHLMVRYGNMAATKSKNKSTLSNLIACFPSTILSFALISIHQSVYFHVVVVIKTNQRRIKDQKSINKNAIHIEYNIHILYIYLYVCDVYCRNRKIKKKEKRNLSEWASNRIAVIGMGNGNAPLLNVDPFRMSICSKWMLKSTVTSTRELKKKQTHTRNKEKKK